MNPNFSNLETQFDHVILSILQTSENKYDIHLSLQEINELVSKKLKTSFQGERYKEFRTRIRKLEERQFIELRKSGSKVKVHLTNAGKHYLNHGRYVPFPSILSFYCLKKPFYALIIAYAFIYLSFFLLLNKPISAYMQFKVFWIVILILLGIISVHEKYTCPEVKVSLGINLKKHVYDLFHPFIPRLINNNIFIEKEIKHASLTSLFLTLTTVVVVYYLPFIDKGVTSPGFFGVIVTSSRLIFLYNMMFFPLLNGILFFFMYLLFLSIFWVFSIPFFLPLHDVYMIFSYLQLFCLKMKYYLIGIEITILFSILFALKTTIPFYNKAVLFVLLIISSAITIIFLLLNLLIHVRTTKIKQYLKTHKE